MDVRGAEVEMEVSVVELTFRYHDGFEVPGCMTDIIAIDIAVVCRLVTAVAFGQPLIDGACGGQGSGQQVHGNALLWQVEAIMLFIVCVESGMAMAVGHKGQQPGADSGKPATGSQL